jgi:nicotinic acid mononucleotide adenylyltransferase
MPTNEQIEKTYKQFFDGTYELCSPQTIMHRVKSQVPHQDCRIATRLWLDHYYKKLMTKSGSYQACLDAGYFDDGSWDSVFLRLDQEVGRMLTPFQIIVDSVNAIPKDNDKPLAVLLTTGCFAPVHVGHFEMMEQAKVAVQKAGYHVLGGYMSPSHDNYVRTKEDTTHMNIMKRIQILELAAVNHGWIHVDPWEGVYNSISVNFTDVIAYLKNYLNYHIDADRTIEIFYVFGADNAHFAPVFYNKGKCVIASRHGYTIPNIEAHPNILVAHSVTKREISSTTIRKGYHEFLPSSVLEIYRNSIAIDKSRCAINIAIRNDSAHSLSNWVGVKDCELDLYNNYQGQFASELKNLLMYGYSSCDTKIHDVNLAMQQKYIKLLRSKGTGYVLSLDPLCPVANNIRLSRLFPMSGNQLKRIDTVIENVKMHSPSHSSKCYIVDDDIVSGKTMEYVKNAFVPIHLDVTQVSLLDHGLPKNHPKIVFDEILDERDFLIGSKDGGLMCMLPNGKHARVPYILPFVNPLWRASMDADKVINFSREVWMRNIDFYSIYTNIRVEDSDPKFQTLCFYLGYHKDTTLLQIATDYHTILSRYRM